MAYASGCPVVGANPANQMPPSANEPLPGQSKPLSTWRQPSNIPTGAAGEALPQHQAPATGGGEPVWVYPSEQMFYNAMKRKGWTPAEDDMAAVVAIHNAAWREIQRWEEVKGVACQCGGPRLVKFRGRPQEFSPKARLLNLLGYRLPFDRHDWVVDRCGEEVRYVIDFYNAAPREDMPVAMHLDVRPALDSFGALWDRLKMQFGWVASGRWTRE
ncbi:hypothetical protein COHA_002375 [Chlorella ohadii]|uniref:Holocytochrome c-type synthase n=1 Tax=Chlorella ohadii TaxID=2649997 RepID=A0AAD5DXJ8_9CHLO|nr:hypothetical protein COHA_002375 [Chlorella ohadii]